MLTSCLLEEATHDPLGVEVFRRDIPDRAGVDLVTALDGVERSEHIIDGPKREQAAACRQDMAEACVLGDHGLAGGQVAGASVAEPATPQPDILILRNGELAPRAEDIV